LLLARNKKMARRQRRLLCSCSPALVEWRSGDPRAALAMKHGKSVDFTERHIAD
jgi:hypothetical protein